MVDSNLEDEIISVFISYSWDNEEHKEWVLKLANELTDNRINVVLDRFDLTAGKGMTQFMEKAVNRTNKVLLILTPNYKHKADNRIGGVGYEYSMVSQEFYENNDTDKFIPIVREGSFDSSAPYFIKSVISHSMTNDETYHRDFDNLLRIIYDEPEIKRPPLGKKPSFVQKGKSNVNERLINNELDSTVCQMSAVANWRFDISINSLFDNSHADIYNLISSNIINDEYDILLPHILNSSYKISHHPSVLFEVPLQRELAYNHLTHEKLQIINSNVRYEFAEYGDQKFWLLYISQPFSSLFYILSILQSIHQQLDKPVDISLKIEFESNRKSQLYKPHSPFDYPRKFDLQTMTIPEKGTLLEIELNEISKDTVFSTFSKIYSLFSAENPKSPIPFIELNRDFFNMAAEKFIK